MAKDPFYHSEKKRYKNPIPSREWILQSLEDTGKPISFEQLANQFKLDNDAGLLALKKRLNAMVRDGQLIRNNNADFVLVAHLGLCKGRICYGKDRQPYMLDEQSETRYTISGFQLTELVEGDYVLARRLSTESVVIVEIIGRDLKSIIGRVQKHAQLITLLPLKHCCYSDPIIIDSANKLKSHDMVEVNIVEMPKPGKPMLVEVKQVLPNRPDLQQQIDILCSAFGIETTFNHLYEFSQVSDFEGRTDWRALPFVTIDGADAKDFDDAICVKKTKKGFEAYVAIADVTHYVKHDSPLDKEAANRGTSVYFPQRVVPMLPQALSNDLCSLVPHQDRLVLGLQVQLTQQGQVTAYQLHEAVICSHARLTYDAVQAMMDQKKAMPQALETVLPPMIELATKLNDIKNRRGALRFNRSALVPNFKGMQITGFTLKPSNDAMRLVEVYMLLANELVAEHCQQHDIPCLYRNHGKPDLLKLAPFFTMLEMLGVKIKKQKNHLTPKKINEWIEALGPGPMLSILEHLLLRALPQAVYQPESKGHFGLAYAHYLHFTSPIRRYPDLLVHRQLKRSLNKKPLTIKGLNALGAHCSRTERRAEQACRWVEGWLKCQWMETKINQMFTGKVSSVTAFGLFVTLDDCGVDGLIHIAKLPKDYYEFNEKHANLVGQKSKRVFSIGDAVKIRVTQVNIEQQRIDFLLVD